MAYLLSYNRLPVDSVIYDPRLAYSMHPVSYTHLTLPTTPYV